MSAVSVTLGVVVNGLLKVTVTCSPAASGYCGLGSGGVGSGGVELVNEWVNRLGCENRCLGICKDRLFLCKLP